jgi:hypothetical protein
MPENNTPLLEGVTSPLSVSMPENNTPLLEGVTSPLSVSMPVSTTTDNSVTISAVIYLSSAHQNKYTASERNVSVSTSESVTISDATVLNTPAPHEHVIMDTGHTNSTMNVQVDLSSSPSSSSSLSSSPSS